MSSVRLTRLAAAALASPAASASGLAAKRPKPRSVSSDSSRSASESGSAKTASGLQAAAAAAAAASPPRRKKNKSTRKATTALPAREPPAGWRSDYELMVALRSERTAPVDSMGGHVLGADDPFHVLVALMLSSQTKDQTVAEAMARLKAHGLSAANIAATEPEALNELICKVGFHNNKTKYLKAAADDIVANGGRVPDTLDGLVGLKGVGPKMAFLILEHAFGKTLGIGVDTHVHRFCNTLEWVESKTPEQTRVQLEAWLPQEEWGRINYIMVGIGQSIQQPKPRENMLRHLQSWTNEELRENAGKLLCKLGLKPSHLD